MLAVAATPPGDAPKDIPPGLAVLAPDEISLDPARLQGIDAKIEQAIAAGKMPGCVLCFGRAGKIGWLRAYGNKQLLPEKIPMTVDTVFDLASLTKPIATATAIMKLIETGRLRLDQKVSDIFPAFATHGKDRISVRHLLIHQSGLIPDNPLSDYQQGADVAWEKICDLRLVAPVGEQFKYSDVNYIVLGKIVQEVSGTSLDEYAHRTIFLPSGMTQTGFLPDETLRARAAPTEQREGEWMQGEVHDPRAFLLEGVAGHAGLFSTAEDLARFASMMLSEGLAIDPVTGRGERVLGPLTVGAMTADYPVSAGIRGLGWDKQTGFSTNKGDLLSKSAFGHGGFTGTVIWMDPQWDLFFIFLSNRLHPSGDGSVNVLAGELLNIVASASTGSATVGLTSPRVKAGVEEGPRHGEREVLVGIDVLQRDDFRPLAGKRVGLITNQTGRNRSGQSTAKILRDSPQVDLKALFSPEHGIEGKLDIPVIQDAEDPSTGLQVYSLYGTSRRPTPEMLAQIDILVFDLQDLGTRFYTYISTMGEAMRAAAQAGKAFMVLDRPNPINGTSVAGPMLDEGAESFVGFHPLPIRHAMTIGELALMFRSELDLDLELVVIPCEHWDRRQYWDQTGLVWVNPSPNMRSLNQAILYPGIGVLEFTNLSVGRGTDTPFEVVGAPWVDHRQLARYLGSLGIPGAVFVPIEFTPRSSKFSGELCFGINIDVIDRQSFDPLHAGLAIATGLRRFHKEVWDVKELHKLLGNSSLTSQIIDGVELPSLLQHSTGGREQYLQRRAPFLLYPLAN